MRSATLFDADAASYTGTVEVLGVIFRAEDDGYAVLEVQEAGGGEGFALVGPVAHLGPGDRAEVSGEWQTHSRYGRQMRAQGALPLDPADREGQVAYLSTLRHIGKKRAERLVDEHGEGVLAVIAADPQRTFQALKGVSVDQAAAATQSWHESRAVRELHVQLAPHGLAHLAAPIHARFAERSLAILHEDPYRLTEVEGVGFARADKIALAADVPPESDKRAQAAAVYALREAEQGGNSFLPMEGLAARTAKLTGLVPDPAVLAEARGLVDEEGRVYRELTLESERAVAATLARRLAAPPYLDHDPGESDPEEAMTEEQRTAQINKWTGTMREHWRAENNELVNDGKGDYATTEKDYGDFELLVEYKTVPKADSGIYLRGVPQVQIWDSTEEAKFNLGANKGSGGLWNNSPGAQGKDPLVKADKPFGEWNRFRIRQIGARTWIWLNDRLVVDGAVMENFWDRTQPLPAKGPIMLQTHGGEIRWRNLFVREIGAEEARRILAETGK